MAASMNSLPNEPTTAWLVVPTEAVFAKLESTPSGLSGMEATRRLTVHGLNELQAPHGVSPWRLLLEQFQNVLIVILLVAIALSAFLGHGVEAIAIAVIVLFAVLLGFVQEYRAERAIQALRQMAAPLATVLRAGQEMAIPARELVPGDVILLRAGDKVPGDARLIEAAVEEGRGVFENIKKYLMFLLSSNIGEIGLMTGASLAGLPLPLTAVQILYVNLATDGLPALALAVDPPEPDLMRRPPRAPRSGIFTRPVVTLMTIGGFWSALVNVSLFAWALHTGRSLEEATTMTFVSLVLIQFFKAYNFRSDRHSVLNRPFANKWLNIAIFWEVLLLVLVVYVPFLQAPFDTFSLTLIDWAIVMTSALTISPVLELAKWFERRGWFGELDCCVNPRGERPCPRPRPFAKARRTKRPRRMCPLPNPMQPWR